MNFKTVNFVHDLKIFCIYFKFINLINDKALCNIIYNFQIFLLELIIAKIKIIKSH